MCTNPKKAFQIGFTKNGKPSYLICDKEVHHLEKGHKGKYNKILDWKVSPGCEGAITEFIEVPCGSCKECRLQHAKQWADRCLLEMQYHDSNLFVTLTYDDEHLPKVKADWLPDKPEFSTLRKRDLQLFFKRLRKRFGQGISFYACGELGSHTLRPHYHAIIFGLTLDDLTEVYSSDLGNTYYESAELNKIWTNGFCTVSPATYENAAYTARYVMKKADLPDMRVYLESNGCENEFTTMSRRPAIGKRWFDEHPDLLYTESYTNIGTANGSKKIYRNRYFDKLMDIRNPVLLDMVKKTSQEFAKDLEKIKLDQTSLSRNEQFAVEEEIISHRLNSLERNGF